MSSDTLVAASAKPMILALLLSGESYGYQILQRVHRVSGGELEWSSAMIYPVLRRLEKEGLIRSDWRVSGENRMRRYYRLTDLGRGESAKEKARWLSVNGALRKAWATAGAEE
ncbi:MAG TPA: helix-turn-helix transcriptional regulator [Candidatus Aminicenantes bacterium]|nr:helix-turn-helix transcriptional regulator [Candidatus Aminicenantes bacterium]HRY65162.1 helix-turn-helix transcriptional regulator [Candidatus Aminicenantes bacterium]HRZ72370.1 helix-turn-helix transcriptional regulator [Candidatus Aminicenantes bacterium]